MKKENSSFRQRSRLYMHNINPFPVTVKPSTFNVTPTFASVNEVPHFESVHE